MSAAARPPAPIAATFTVSLGGGTAPPAISLRGSTLNAAAPPAPRRNILRENLNVLVESLIFILVSMRFYSPQALSRGDA